MRRLIKSILLFALLFLNACATAIPTRTETPVAVTPLVSATKDCEYLMRDLSVDWSLRHYWCGSSDADETINAQAEKNRLMLMAIERTRLRLAALRKQMNTVDHRADYVASKITPYLSQQTVMESNATASHEPQRQQTSSNHTTALYADEMHSSNHHRIVFAHGRETLGPKGHMQTLNLMPVVRNARRVTLRGQLTNGEFPLVNAIAAEKRSVGRSLSVRELWRSSGIDVAAVTILHHSPEVSGRYVEVTVYE